MPFTANSTTEASPFISPGVATGPCARVEVGNPPFRQFAHEVPRDPIDRGAAQAGKRLGGICPAPLRGIRRPALEHRLICLKFRTFFTGITLPVKAWLRTPRFS